MLPMAFIDAQSIDASSAPGAPPASARWWWAVLVGVIVSLPLGWLLSYGASLLTYLGLFFFMLFGLMIGAAMYRVGLPVRPVPAWRIRLGVAIVVLIGWGVSMGVECYEFPGDVAKRTVKEFKRRPDGMTPEQIKGHAVEWVKDHLRRAYPPGGAIGYMRWRLRSNQLAVQIEGLPAPVRLRFENNGGWWAVRVVLSIVLFAVAIHSVVRPLASPSAPLPAEPLPPRFDPRFNVLL